MIKNIKVLSLIMIGVLSMNNSAFAQNCLNGGSGSACDVINTVTTAVPFLRIAPDARSGAMGDVGIAISADPNSIYWNPAKLAFGEQDLGMAITYTPWLSDLVSDIYLADVSGYKKIDDLQAVGIGVRYFSLGNIVFTDNSGNTLRTFKPNEFAIDAAYARKFTDQLSGALNLKFVYSNLASGEEVQGDKIKAGTTVAADISVYNIIPIDNNGNGAELAWGVNISNIGAKIGYTDATAVKDFIPTNLGIGTAYTMNLDEYNQLTFAFDMNKLLVPTPTPDSLDSNPNNGILDYKEEGVISGIFSSFGDAPGGGKEELREIIFGVGAEYWYDKQFAVRAGYFYEHETKGNRKFLTAGLGLKYSVFGLNFSYLVPTNKGANRNPLDNTLRFSLLFDLGQVGAIDQDLSFMD